MEKKEFSLPCLTGRQARKTKKRLKNGIWLYPPDEEGNSLMASPARSQEDFDAYKKGILRKIGSAVKERKAFKETLDKEVTVTDVALKSYVDKIFWEDIRKSAYQTFKKAKSDKKALVAYHNFINAYELYAAGEESYGNICCMALDLAEENKAHP